MKLPKELMILELKDKEIFKSLKLRSILLDQLIYKLWGKVPKWVQDNYKISQRI